MATTKAHGDHPPAQHFPPSPPPSPSPPASARRRHKKKPDPFEQLAATPLPSAPSSPAASSDSNTTAEEEPLLTRILLTPLLFTSFLLSLFLVNYRNRIRRAQTNASSSTPSLLTYLVPSRWLDPEPYQDPLDTTWGHRNTSAPHAEPHDAISPRPGEQQKRGSWHLHKKIRKVAKLEVGDALEMRGRVMVGMMAGLVMVCVAGCMGLRWCFGVVAQALRA